MSEADAPLVALGLVTAPFGVKGWVKVRSDTDPDERLFAYDSLCLRRRGICRSLRIESTGRSGGQLTAKFAGIDDRDAAAGLAGSELCVPRAALPPEGPGEYYRTDLIGCRVVDLAGRDLGVLDHFVESPAHPLMVVRGATELWIPAVPRHLRQVDLTQRRVLVDWSDAE